MQRNQSLQRWMNPLKSRHTVAFWTTTARSARFLSLQSSQASKSFRFRHEWWWWWHLACDSHARITISILCHHRRKDTRPTRQLLLKSADKTFVFFCFPSHRRFVLGINLADARQSPKPTQLTAHWTLKMGHFSGTQTDTCQNISPRRPFLDHFTQFQVESDFCLKTLSIDSKTCTHP